MADLITHLRRHVTLTDTEETRLMDLMRPVSFLRKELILREGEICMAISFINKGSLRCYYTSAAGRETTIMFAFAGWWITDMASFSNALPSTTSIIALEDTECLQLTCRQFDQILTEIPKLERYFRILMQNAYIREQQRVRETISLPAAERYTQLIDCYPQLEQRVSQKNVASYLGITPQALSTLRRKRKER